MVKEAPTASVSDTIDESNVESQTIDSNRLMTSDQILRTHIHLCHDETGTLARILKLAGETVSVEDIEKAMIP